MEAVERLSQKPVFVLCIIGIANRWFDNCYFIVRKNALAECILAISLVQHVVFLDAMLTTRRMLSRQSTDAYFLGLDQTLSSWFPKATMRDLAQRGLNILSFLIVRTHIIGIARGEPFCWSALYLARVSFLISVL